jgi:hypothetical protein
MRSSKVERSSAFEPEGRNKRREEREKRKEKELSPHSSTVEVPI